MVPGRADLPQPRPDPVDADRERARSGEPAGPAPGDRQRRDLRPDPASSRRPLLAGHDRSGADGPRAADRVGRGSGRAVERTGLRRGRARGGSRSRLGLRRRMPPDVVYVRRRLGHPAGRGRPVGRRPAVRAAAALERNRAGGAGGPAPAPTRRLVVPADRRGRNRARPRGFRGAVTIHHRAVRGQSGEPDSHAPQHRRPGPEHRPRGPGHAAVRAVGGGLSRRAAAWVRPAVPRQRTRDVPRRHPLGGRLAGLRRGALPGAAGRHDVHRRFRRRRAAAAVDLPGG